MAKTSFHTLGLVCIMRLTRPYAWQRSVNLVPLYDCAMAMSRAKNRRPNIYPVDHQKRALDEVDFMVRRRFTFCQSIMDLATRR